MGHFLYGLMFRNCHNRKTDPGYEKINPRQPDGIPAPAPRRHSNPSKPAV
jgi:hypothetical protein